MASAFKSIVWCEVLSLDESFQGTCFGHAFLKACKYVIIDEKVYKNLRFCFKKVCLVIFAKMYNLVKMSGKNR
jgi:hypothetical protein